MNYYKKHYKIKTSDHKDWYIQVDTTSNSDRWSVEYEYVPDEHKEHLPEELFEI